MKPTDEEIIALLLKHADVTKRGMYTSEVATYFGLIGTYWIRKQLKRMQRHHTIKTCYPYGRNYCWAAYKEAT